MRAQFWIENPDKIEATIKITMTMKEWSELCEQLQSKWPSSRLGQAITHLLSEARKIYYAPDQDALVLKKKVVHFGSHQNAPSNE